MICNNNPSQVTYFPTLSVSTILTGRNAEMCNCSKQDKTQTSCTTKQPNLFGNNRQSELGSRVNIQKDLYFLMKASVTLIYILEQRFSCHYDQWPVSSDTCGHVTCRHLWWVFFVIWVDTKSKWIFTSREGLFTVDLAKPPRLSIDMWLYQYIKYHKE